jgi:N4-gp56 family major capsid protein
MADEHLWTDLGGGLMGNHQISDELLWASTGECRIVPFTKDFGFGFKKNAGDTVNMYHVLPIPDVKDASLQEEGEVPVRMLAFGLRSLTLTEHGTALTFTHKLELLFKFKPDAIFREALSLHLAETMDNECSELGFLSSDVKIVFTPSSLTGVTYSTTGTPPAVANYPMTKDHIKKISQYMWDTIHVPFYNRPRRKSIGNTPAETGGNDHYVCLSAGSNIENLLLDPTVERWQQAMGKGDMLYKNEQCNLHNIRFVRINRQNAMGDETGTSTQIGDACFFGDQGVARIEAETPSLRLNPNWGGKGGLIHAMLWYGVYTFGPVWNYSNDGLAKMIRWGSL